MLPAALSWRKAPLESANPVADGQFWHRAGIPSRCGSSILLAFLDNLGTEIDQSLCHAWYFRNECSKLNGVSADPC